jgi:NADH dehydrogenase (ubiquinone) 1 alpha subcomplex subunit 13
VYSELAREKMWSRIHLIPVLQAEEDRDLVRRYLSDRAREKQLLGSETKVYNSDRYDHTFAAFSGLMTNAAIL